MATISVLSSATESQDAVLTSVDNVCNGGGNLTNTQLTADGRYLVSIWPDLGFSEAALSVVDVTTGDLIDVTDGQIDAWATAQTGTGLDAAEESLTISGFDRTGSGTVYFFGGQSGDDNYNTQALTYYSQDIAQLIDDSGALSIEQLPDERWCYGSTLWSTDGGHCLLGYSDIVPSAAGPVRTTDPYNTNSIFDDRVGFYSGCDQTWLDATTVISVDCGGKTLYRDVIGQQEATVVYGISGDRSMQAAVNRTTGEIFIVSPTLDGSSTELFRVPGEPGAEPVLISTYPAPAKISLVSN